MILRSSALSFSIFLLIAAIRFDFGSRVLGIGFVFFTVSRRGLEAQARIKRGALLSATVDISAAQASTRHRLGVSLIRFNPIDSFKASSKTFQCVLLVYVTHQCFISWAKPVWSSEIAFHLSCRSRCPRGGTMRRIVQGVPPPAYTESRVIPSSTVGLNFVAFRAVTSLGRSL